MSKYNIYAVEDVESLVDELKAKDYSAVAEYEAHEVSFSLYVSGKQYGDLWWVNQYGDVLPTEYQDLKATTYSAALVAITKEASYAISMGRSFFIIDNYCDKDFGISIAQRAGDNAKSKMKSSSFNGGVKSRAIVSNSDYTNLDFSGGESVGLLKMKALEEMGLGKSAILFGSSVQLANVDISYKELGKVLNELDTLLAEEPKFRVPRSVRVTDEKKIAKLNANLVKTISSGSETASIGLYDFDNFGVYYFFTDDVKWQLKYKNDLYETEYDHVDVTTIKEFCKDHGLKLEGVFRDLKLVAKPDSGHGFTRELTRFIDYTDDEENCYLENGQWRQFNNDYLEDMQYWLSHIRLENLEYEFDAEEFERWRETEKTKKKPSYKELFYNTKLEEQFGYKLYDRHMDSKLKRNIEVCDLYDKSQKKIIVTKRGEPKDLGYAVDQASSVFSLIVNGKYTPEKTPKKKINIDNVELLLIFTKRQTSIKSLDDIKSFTFLSKINALYALCREKGLGFNIRFSYEAQK